MTIHNRRLERWKAQETGDQIDVFVKEQTGNWGNPVVSTAKVAEEFEMSEEEVIEHLRESPLVMSKEIEDGVYVWW